MTSSSMPSTRAIHFSMNGDSGGTHSGAVPEMRTLGGTATENDDFEPEHSEYHSKRSAGNMNHTFHTMDDDLFEGDETY